jgi:hypothetical protein
MLKTRTLAAVGLLVLTASAATIAVQAGDRNSDKHGLGWGLGGSNGQYGSFGQNGNNGTVVGAPGPIAGVGLPMLAIAGGYAWIRRQRQKNQR